MTNGYKNLGLISGSSCTEDTSLLFNTTTMRYVTSMNIITEEKKKQVLLLKYST